MAAITLTKHLDPPGVTLDATTVVPATLATGTRPLLWDEGNQATLLHSLEGHLPRVERIEEGDVKKVLFHLPWEALKGWFFKRARPLRWWRRIPREELRRLAAACENLRERQESTGRDRLAPGAQAAIAALKFPNPEKDRDYYQLYGWPWNPQLFIVWGIDYPEGGIEPKPAIAMLERWSLELRHLRLLFLYVPIALALMLGGVAAVAGPRALAAIEEHRNREALAAALAAVNAAGKLEEQVKAIYVDLQQKEFGKIRDEAKVRMSAASKGFEDERKRDPAVVFANPATNARYGKELRAIRDRTGLQLATAQERFDFLSRKAVEGDMQKALDEARRLALRAADEAAALTALCRDLPQHPTLKNSRQKEGQPVARNLEEMRRQTQVAHDRCGGKDPTVMKGVKAADEALALFRNTFKDQIGTVSEAE